MYHNFLQKYFNRFNPQFAYCFPAQFFSLVNLKQSRLRKINVLLVDDHQLMRKGIRRVIEYHDDIVIIGEAADGKEAIKLAQATRPDIILMDVNMPVMDGIEATRKITTELSQICVIGLSMNEEGVIEEDMKSAGASAYIQKSEAFESLIKTIRTEASSY